MLTLDTIESILQVMVIIFVGGAALSAVWWFYVQWLGLRDWWRELARQKRPVGSTQGVKVVRHYNALPMAPGDDGAERRAVEARQQQVTGRRQQQIQARQLGQQPGGAYRVKLPQQQLKDLADLPVESQKAVVNLIADAIKRNEARWPQQDPVEHSTVQGREFDEEAYKAFLEEMGQDGRHD